MASLGFSAISVKLPMAFFTGQRKDLTLRWELLLADTHWRWRSWFLWELLDILDAAMNCGVGEDSWESHGLQGDPSSPFWRRPPWDFFGRTNAEAETPVLWPPHVKCWLVGKDSDAGRDWGWEEKGMTEDEMVGWHHWLDAHEFGWTPGVGDGQGGLACCYSWGHKELDTTELNWTELTLWLVDLPAPPVSSSGVLGAWRCPAAGARGPILWTCSTSEGYLLIQAQLVETQKCIAEETPEGTGLGKKHIVGEKYWEYLGMQGREKCGI